MNFNNYGFQFSDIIIQDDIVIKTGKTPEGIQKIQREIRFYSYISEGNINFCIPKLIKYTDNQLVISYVKNPCCLTHLVNNKNINNYIENIMHELSSIHSITCKKKQSDIINDITIETQDKIISRFLKTNWLSLQNYEKITHVNGLKVKNIHYYAEYIKQRLILLVIDKGICEYSLIHGDTHLGNILYSNDDKKLYFIDPRGFFGNSELFGLKEYDYAKLLFGISGYSIFDTMNIDKLIINDNNLTIDFIKEYEYIFNSSVFDEITRLLALSIWLGNNSSFLDNNKKITSLFIALYYCEKYC